MDEIYLLMIGTESLLNKPAGTTERTTLTKWLPISRFEKSDNRYLHVIAL